jgi:hypothetical protein
MILSSFKELKTLTTINVGSLWKIAKNPNGTGHIIRSANAVHRSSKVHDINRKFAKVAESCKGKGGGRAAFRTCVADGMKGKRAGEKD